MTPPAPRRVLHVVTGLDGGGAERFLADLLPRLTPRPADASVLVLQGPGVVQPAVERAAAVFNLGARRGRIPGPLACARAWRWVKARRPDAVLGWMYHGDLAAVYAARAAGPGTGLAWTVHQTPADPADERWLTRRVIAACRRRSRRPGRIVYVSARSRAEHASRGFYDGRAVVVPNGFDLARFRPDADGGADGPRAAVRRELGLAPGTPLLLRVARIDPMKDYPSLLDAFVRVRAAMPDAALAVAGRGAEPDAPAFAAWRAAHPEDARRVRWLGWRADAARLAAAADVAVSSSSMKEAFPLVLGEAMACGVPCVATDVGDAAELVGDTGRIVPPRAPAALAGAVVELLAMPAAARRALGAAAHARVAARFSLDGAAAAYARVLADCVAFARAPGGGA